jgi:hypothetical protein
MVYLIITQQKEETLANNSNARMNQLPVAYVYLSKQTIFYARFINAEVPL